MPVSGEVSLLRPATCSSLFDARILPWVLCSLVPLSLTSDAAVAGQAAGSANHTVIALPDGSVWAWGLNSYGQLGDGTISPRSEPTQVSSIGGIVAVAAGGAHTLAQSRSTGYKRFITGIRTGRRSRGLTTPMMPLVTF